MVERRSCKADVVSSNPTEGTILRMTIDNRCTLPFTGTHVLNLKNHTFATCCRSEHNSIDKSTGILTPSLIELRKAVIDNKRSPLCLQCWDRDDKTGMSYRRMQSLHFRNPVYWENKWDTLDPYQPVDGKIEIVFSNKCQLMCIYCGPNVSSMWEENRNNFSNKFLTYEINSRPVLDIDDFIDISKTMEINITGGEPMMEPACIDFLLKLEPDMNRAITIITNLSYGPATFNSLLSIIERHKRVLLGVSLDTLGKNATRKYLNWYLWKRNFEELASSLNERSNVY